MPESFSKKYNLTRHMRMHITNVDTINDKNEIYSDNENVVISNFHKENNLCDKNNNTEEIIPETLVSNYNADIFDKLKRNCVSCKKKSN